jgi:ABC-2 type transport system ATP-binding protein
MNMAIRTENLKKHFGRTAALDGVNLAVPEGAIYALVGPNGAGKTTLIKLLMNIFRPTTGRADVLGENSRRLAGRKFNRIGYVSESQEMPDWMTVGAMLDYWRPFYPQWDQKLERQLTAQFDLPLKRRLGHLSRGMRMKAAFVSALAYRPSLMVLDEPFSGLDPLVRNELIDSLLDRAPETTIFLSSHDLAEIESFASHIGYLEKGGMHFSEEMTALSERFREVTVTLDEPQSVQTELPLDWLQVDASGHVIRFVHSGYQGAATERQIAETYPAARSICFDPMPLRSIFLAVAKEHRGHSQIGADRDRSMRVES